MVKEDGWQELGGGIYLLVREPFHVNVGLIVGGARALLVDTGASLRDGEELVGLARARTDLPLGAVNSHSHFDHCFGNGALDGDVIWSHRLGAEHLRWDGEERQREIVAWLRTRNQETAQEVAKSPLVIPGCLLDDEVELDLGGTVVTLVHPGRGHTDHDVAAWIPGPRILFAGDLLEEGSPPSFEDSFPLEWPDSLAALLALDPSKIVPGHGSVVDLGFARQQHQDLQQLAALARQGFRRSERPTEIDSKTAFPGRPAQTAIRRAYGQLAAISSGAWAERQPG
ncbi:MAG: MBL fold metallo-hydrolase [Candidatus Dormibacteria bacterium]